MLIVGENLQQLVDQHALIDNPKSFDNFSLTLRLDKRAIFVEPGEKARPVVYGQEVPADWLREAEIPKGGHVLQPGGCFLGCSMEKVAIPLGYFGFIQTKGSLARLFVTVQCCDGQVEPGYSGNVTFEICNIGNFAVKLDAGNEVAQLFILKTSTKSNKPYNGRYQAADGPTLFRRPK